MIDLFREVSEIDIKTELPSFEKFLSSIADQRTIKFAFLEAFKNRRMSKEPKILEIQKKIPELGL